MAGSMTDHPAACGGAAVVVGSAGALVGAAGVVGVSVAGGAAVSGAAEDHGNDPCVAGEPACFSG